MDNYIVNIRFPECRIAPVLTGLLFSIFVVFYLFRSFYGLDQCNCAGFVELPSWCFLFFDFVVLAFLVLLPENREKLTIGFRVLAKSFSKHQFEYAALALLGMLSLYFLVHFELQMAEGLPIKGFVDLGPVTISSDDMDGDVILCDGTVHIVNNSDNVVSLTGMEQSCTCFRIDGASAQQITAYESVKLPFHFKRRKSKKKESSYVVVFYVDHPKQFRVVIPLNVDG